MHKLEEFEQYSNDYFTWYLSAEADHQWRTLVFSCHREALEEVALDAMTSGVPQCKISQTPWKKSRIFNLTLFHPTIAQAMAFRSKWYDDSVLAIAGPIPLKPIESRYLEQEQGQRALETLMEDLRGTPLSVDTHGNPETSKPSKRS